MSNRELASCSVPALTIDAKTQIEAKGAKASVAADGQSLEVILPDAQGEQSVALKPPAGRWDLRDATEVRVKLKNDRPIADHPQRPGDAATAVRPTSPPPPLRWPWEKTTQLVASFIPAVPGKGVRVPKAGILWQPAGHRDQLQQRCSRRRQDHGQACRRRQSSGRIDHGRCAPAVLPDWLGKRPPVPGDWVKTFDEEFDGPTIDQKKWNIYGPNYWDRASHWTKDNLILEGGAGEVPLREETRLPQR